MTDVHIRPPTADDLPWMYELNQSCVPEVGDVTSAEFAELVELASFARVAVVSSPAASGPGAGAGAGLLVCLSPGTAYASPNYRFFEDQARPHLYNDRIAIADGHRGRGVGRRLYEASFEFAREHGLLRVTCEVNVKPPNPASLAMHGRLGFTPVEDRADPRNGKVVRMLERVV